MRRSSLVLCALLLTATFGCEQVKKQVANVQQRVQTLRERLMKKKGAEPSRPVPAPAPPPAPVKSEAPPPPPVTQRLASAHPHRDEPYVSADTGTVFPGMSEKDVYSLWGPPVAVRHLGEFTYLYFKNGCEYSCGHLDVVTLQNGQVSDAIVRWPGHGYSGQSTSPPGTESHAPRGGDTLQLAPPPTVNGEPPAPSDTTPTVQQP